MKLSILKKLLLSSLLLLFIPWIGYQSIQDIEDDLRRNQEIQLTNRAKLVSIVLQDHSDLFKSEQNTITPEIINHVFVRQLQSTIQLDGYSDDWQEYNDRFRDYGLNYTVSNSNMISSLSYEHQVGSYKRYLYAIFKVSDDKIVYRRPGSFQLDKSDHLRINLINPKGELLQYILTSQSSGWVTAHKITPHADPIPELYIKGEWQETESGYNIEIRIPLKNIGNMISFAIADVDDSETREIREIIGTSDPDNPYSLASIIVPSPVVESLLKKIHQGTSRTWVIDRNYRVIAAIGNLKHQVNYSTSQVKSKIPHSEIKSTVSVFQNIKRLFYQIVLSQPNNQFIDNLSSASILNGDEFKAALTGIPKVQWRNTPDTNINILTATHPVKIDNNVVGAIAIEETNNSILILQNRAFEILINLSMLAFIIAFLLLLVFATRLSSRIRRLRNDAENAISNDGRVLANMQGMKSSDEIGDLSRSFSNMLARLSQYNRYLETMASKLSHELRTPITVVRSSLDNLELNKDGQDSSVTLNRAREGIDRLNNILTRMSEATRLEQILNSEKKQAFKLDEVISACIAGYRLANPSIQFELTISNNQVFQITGVPEYIAQQLDKLISNAIDFHLKKSSINILLIKTTHFIELSVANSGPSLPLDMQYNLFESMVSIREPQGTETHLGLGLYIVRLIADFHDATVMCRNLIDNTGVQFLIRFPL